ncbi:Protein FAR1-RELATED SEQUENCE 5 [Glycine soja]
MDSVVVDSDKGNEAEHSCLEESISIFGGVEVQEPYVGMEFGSEEDARKFYVDYARRVGFVVRIMQRRRSGIDGRTLARRLGCNKQGFSPNNKGILGPEKKPRPSAREGCKATILVKLEKSGKWIVTRFVKDHNHPLIATANGFSTAKIAETAAYMEATQEEDDEEEDGIQEIARLKSGKRPPATSNEASSIASKKRTTNKKGPLDFLFSKEPEESIKFGKTMRQTSVNESYNKASRDRAVQYIARFFFRNGIAFNVAKSKSFKLMIQAIGIYGPHLKPPSYHELRVPLLKKELEYMKGLLRGHEEKGIKYGCSIMKNRTLINFLVNCSLGTQFVRSVDASEYMKTGQKIFDLLDSFVEEIGEKNVIQVVTDNRRVGLTRPNLTRYVIQKCNGETQHRTQHATRSDIPHPAVTVHSAATTPWPARTTQQRRAPADDPVKATPHRPRTSHPHEGECRGATSSKAAKEPKGKKAADVVLMPSFWNDAVYTLKAMGPLVSVLRKTAMGFIYEAMDRAKEAIQRAFNNNEGKYKDILAIIDKRWDCQLHHPLHATGYYLNPKFFYTNPNIDNDNEVVDDLYKCIDRLSEDDDFVVEVHKQLLLERGLIHSKKRSRLEHQKLQDLVYVKYNQALLDRFECHDDIDPIALNDIDNNNEWLLGELEGEEAGNDLVFDDDDDLNWLDVAEATGTGEPLQNTRSQTQINKAAAAPAPTNEKGK